MSQLCPRPGRLHNPIRGMATHRCSTEELVAAAESREDELAGILDPFAMASPELLRRRSLLRRTCSKFLLRADDLPDLLWWLRRDYAVLRAAGRNLASYRTLYFDTPELQCFHDHRRGRRPRHKVRIRHYPDRRLTFFELKTKQSDLITHKRRLDLPYGDSALSERAHDLLRQHAGALDAALDPQVWTNFRRLTLIGLERNERVTIDTDLQIGPAGRVERLGHVAVMEVKQAPFCGRTPVMIVLRAAGLQPISTSKYCTALALTRPGLRLNRLLPGLRAIERMRT
jgi:hypothetical protein